MSNSQNNNITFIYSTGISYVINNGFAYPPSGKL